MLAFGRQSWYTGRGYSRRYEGETVPQSLRASGQSGDRARAEQQVGSSTPVSHGWPAGWGCVRGAFTPPRGGHQPGFGGTPHKDCFNNQQPETDLKTSQEYPTPAKKESPDSKNKLQNLKYQEKPPTAGATPQPRLCKHTSKDQGPTAKGVFSPDHKKTCLNTTKAPGSMTSGVGSL